MKNRWNFRNPAISKYHGLQKIYAYALPHPDWIFVSGKDEIPARPWTDAGCGWTIRCAPTDKYEFGLPSKHKQPYHKLVYALENLRWRSKANCFVIYPSWEFDRSGCCIISPHMIIIEVVTGDIGALLQGSKSPEAVYNYETLYSVRQLSMQGKYLLDNSEKALILKSCRKILPKNEVVLEWTITKRGKLFFHDWFEFK